VNYDWHGAWRRSDAIKNIIEPMIYSANGAESAPFLIASNFTSRTVIQNETPRLQLKCMNLCIITRFHSLCFCLHMFVHCSGIDKLRTTAFPASANGRIERVHRTLNTLLSKVVSENQRLGRTFAHGGCSLQRSTTRNYTIFAILFDVWARIHSI